MLQFASDAPNVENPVGAFHPFQVDSNDIESISKEEVGRSSVAMHKYLLIFPHTRLLTPAIPQPVQLVRFVTIDEVAARELAYQMVEIGTIFVKIDAIAIRRPVMQCSE